MNYDTLIMNSLRGDTPKEKHYYLIRLLKHVHPFDVLSECDECYGCRWIDGGVSGPDPCSKCNADGKNK